MQNHLVEQIKEETTNLANTNIRRFQEEHEP
jgi:hypothetical protein